MKYTIEQFPKNKEIVNLSDEQKNIRNNQKIYIYSDKFTCVKCLKEMSINEFYVADKNNGRRYKSCRDCQMKMADVIEIGKFRFAKKILDKGFRRCSICKSIKPILEYQKNDKSFGGHIHTCKECNYIISQKFIKSQRESIGEFHVKQYGKQKYGITNFNQNIIDKLRSEIIQNRKPKYFLDEQEFLTKAEFARYIETKYRLPITMTEKRLSEGKTEDQCKLTEREMRSIAYTKGKILVVDTVNGKQFIFNNTTDEKLLSMFSKSAISRCINTGEKTKITGLSKYKNPCTISRILK